MDTMRWSTNYYESLIGTKVAIFINVEPFKFIGKIKEVFNDGILLEKSEKFEEVFVQSVGIISVRKWTEKEHICQ